MSLHNEIMNIQTATNEELSLEYGPDHRHTSYKIGHRDARHEAAELSLKYESYIEGLEGLVHRVLCDSDEFLGQLRKESGL
ncbi:hypothetical protein D3C80_768890 [compost metagenome]